MLNKSTIRRATVEKLRGLSPEFAVAVALGVARVLLALPEVEAADTVALYCATAGEIDLETVCARLNRQGKETLLPRYNQAAGAYEMVKVDDWSTDTIVGHYGIREPLPELPAVATDICTRRETLWCVPGLAFDLAGHRLGRGAGYYDRLLAGALGFKIGIAYECQLLARVPSEPHDRVMDMIVTENRCLRCRRQSV